MARSIRRSCVCVLLVYAVVPAGASGGTFNPGCSGTTGDVASLKSAIATANAAAGPDTVRLGEGCVYTLTEVDNYWYGPDGLPPISSEITIDGHGATIARAASAPPFRLFFVGADPTDPDTQEYVSPGSGVLTLREVTLSGGLAKGGDSNHGGGGGGMGGAIFSQGEVVVDRSTLSGNTAQGGSAVDTEAGPSGGGMGTDSDGYYIQQAGGFGPGSFGGAAGGTSFGGGAGFRVTEAGSSGTTSQAGAGGGPRTGLGGAGAYHGGESGDGSGGGVGNVFGKGGAFGAGGLGGGGGVGGGGGQGGGGGGFGGGGGAGYTAFSGGRGGFGGGGGAVLSPEAGAVGGAPGFGGGTPSGENGGGGAGMGGAIFNMQGKLDVRDSTIAVNTALGGADKVTDHGKGIAGAVFNLNGAFTAAGSTFAGNSAAYFAAQIYNLEYDGFTVRSATTTLRDTIVSDGVGSSEWPYDLASDESTYGIAPQEGSSAVADLSQFDFVRTEHVQELGTLTGTPLTGEAMLGPLQANGGPTATMALLPGSAAIDAGDPRCLDLAGAPLGTDQRGRPRPYGAACDIGAYEVSPETPPPGSPVLGGLKVSPRAFAAATHGPSARASRKRRRVGARVSFTLDQPASVRFRVARLVRRGKKKARLKTLSRGFTRKGVAGANRFRFTGRIAGHRLKPGRYRLLATPTAAGGTGATAGAPFRITG